MDRRSMEPRPKAKFFPANWSDLPQELVASIARRIGSAQDFVTFGAVCKPWSHAFTKHDFLGGSTHQVPFLMQHQNSCNTPKWYNLSRGRFSRFHVNIPYRYSCRSSLGWLILQPETRYTSGHAYMFHPINHTRIVLPFCDDSIMKFVLSSGPWFPSGCIAMISRLGKVAFWRPKDKEWRNISFPYIRSIRFDDIAFYRGQIYVVDSGLFLGSMHVYDIDDHKTEARILVLPPKRVLYQYHGKKLPVQLYLVESAGNLLLVLRFRSEPSNKTLGFRVFKVPFDTKEWTEIEYLGNRALFLGDHSASFSVETSDYSRCKANCIYFTTKLIGMRYGEVEQQCGVFNMEDGQVEPLLHESACFVKQYTWIQPSF